MPPHHERGTTAAFLSSTPYFLSALVLSLANALNGARGSIPFAKSGRKSRQRHMIRRRSGCQEVIKTGLAESGVSVVVVDKAQAARLCLKPAARLPNRRGCAAEDVLGERSPLPSDAP